MTFLFTDIEGSTRLWQHDEAAMRSALERHDSILRSAIDGHGGYVFSTGGDGFAAAFARAGEAVAAAVEAQTRLTAEPWPEGAPIRVRMGVHTGEVAERDGDYFGTAVNQTARLMAVGQGGQVLCSQATAAIVGTDVKLVDLGEHRLRDLSVAQRVFQVGDGRFALLRSVDAFPTNLPAQATAFVGRRHQLFDVAMALGASRVVTLTGVGGVGKTRLALQTAAEALPGFADGAWLVELAAAFDPDALIEVIAAALDVPERQGHSREQCVTDFLRSKRLLLVVDNCEHLLDAVARFVDGVVSGCPQVRVLATSREGLGVAGERILVVPSLGLPSDDEADAEAVQLFVERAAEAKEGFALTAANADAIARLVRRLDGIPLAIELAAARVRSLTPAELAERVEERFRLLAGGRRTAVERHQTLRRAIDWSYELLTAGEQVVLNRLAVFAGGCSLASAEAVVSGDGIDDFDVVDLLGRLVDKSLLQAIDTHGVTRYRLLETIRQYAQDRLEAAREADVYRLRHAEHYTMFAAEVGEGTRGRDEVAWTARFEAELDNLRAAVGWAVAGGDADLGLRIVASLALNGTRIGYAAAAWALSVAELPEAASHPLYPVVLGLAGWAKVTAGDLDGGLRTCHDALAAAETLGIPPSSWCRVLASPAGAAGYLGRIDEVAELSVRWVELARGVGDDWELAQALGMSAMPAAWAGDMATVLAATEEALAVARRLGNPTAICYASLCAASFTLQDNPDKAMALLVAAIEAGELVGNQLGVGGSLGFAALIHINRAEWAQAAPFVARSVESFSRAGDRHGLGQNMVITAMILAGLRRDDAAAVLFGSYGVTEALAIPDQWAPVVAESEAALMARMGEEQFAGSRALGASMDDNQLTSLMRVELQRMIQADPRVSPPDGPAWNS